MFYILFIIMSCKKAGTIPIYNDKIVMVDSVKHKGNIVLPKGKIKKNESHLDAALRETYEEAGLRGRIRPGKVYQYKNSYYFILDVINIEQKYNESEKRKRLLLSFKEVTESQNISEDLKEMISKVIKDNKRM